jgi:hypothetical protein
VKYHTIYKITHFPSGKFYIGRHTTNNLDDEYMGSGKYLKHAQSKYGIKEFSKEYLAIYADPYYMYLHEKAIVTEEFCKREDTYNIAPGGFAGGWKYVNLSGLNIYGNNGNPQNFLHGNRLKELLLQKSSYEKYRMKISLSMKGKQNFLGKNHSEETKRKIGEANSKSQLGSKNSQYGTMWITNGKECKKIKKDKSIPEGWNRGRK